MAWTTRPVKAASSTPDPVEQAEAHALAAKLFDALGHFAGEVPLMNELVGALAASALIEELGQDDDEATRYTREGWLAQIAATAERRRRESQGYFLEEVERTVEPSAPDMRIRSVVEARLTRGGSIERVERLYCAMLVGRVGRRPEIVHLRLERQSGP